MKTTKTKKAQTVTVARGEYHGKQGWKVNGPQPLRIFPASIFVRTEACARYIAALLVSGLPDYSERISRAIRSEGHSFTCYPPVGAFNIIGEVA